MQYMSDFFIKKTDLRNLYEKLNLYITTFFPRCIVTINSKSVSYAYPGEYARIFVFQNIEQTALVVMITQNISNKMGENNGVAYKIKTNEDLDLLRSGIRVAMELK